MAVSTKRTMINIVCSVIVLATSVGINFFLSPYIVENIGVEANGFVTLANECVSYAQLIVTALNGMAARFITLAYVKGDMKRANLLYNSVFWGNIVLVLVLIIPAILCVARMELFFDVPAGLLFDVKILFSFVFFNFFVSTALPNWDCGTFATNRLDRSYIPQIIASLLKCALLFCLFTLFLPHVWFVGLAATVVTLAQLSANAYNTHVLTPELKIVLPGGKPLFSMDAVKQLVSSGVWNSIHNVGQTLLNGLDLIICNMFLGATLTGVLSLSKMLSGVIQQLGSSICTAFMPSLTIDYGSDWESLLANLRRAMMLTGSLTTIPLACLIAYGKPFFSLWVPSQESDTLQLLCILGIVGMVLTSSIQVLFNVFTVTNHVKENALAVIAGGIISAVVTIVWVGCFDGSVVVIAGVSSIVNCVRNMVFTVPMAAIYLGLKWSTFYPFVARSVASTAAISLLGVLMGRVLPVTGWLGLVSSIMILCVLGLVINSYIMFGRAERAALVSRVRDLFCRAGV